jgi:hypothetical protein
VSTLVGVSTYRKMLVPQAGIAIKTGATNPVVLEIWTFSVSLN